LSEIDGLARAGGAADNTGLSISLNSGGISAANVPPWCSACPNPKGLGITDSVLERQITLTFPSKTDLILETMIDNFRSRSREQKKAQKNWPVDPEKRSKSGKWQL